MLNFRKKLFLIPILFLVMFFAFSQVVFSEGDFGYNVFEDKLTNKYGFKDSSGNIVIPAKFDIAGGFSEGLACVKIGNKFRFINKSAKLVIPAKFDYTYGFSEGLACVKIGNKFGFINKSAKLVIPAKFDFASCFSGGLASVKIGDDWVKINTEGVVVSMENNNNSNTTAQQKDNSEKNCIATCKAALSVCESNARLLPSMNDVSYENSKEFSLSNCKRDYDSCQYSCKN